MSSQAGVLATSPDRATVMLRRLPAPTAIFVAVLGVILVSITILKGTLDPDYFWHLTTGHYIATHGIPSVDPFSFTWAGKPWTLHEWLSELGLYAIVSTVGTVGAAIVFGAIATGVFAILAAILRRVSVRPLVIVLVCVLGGWVLIPYLTVRPQAISWRLLAGLLAILLWLRADRPRRALLLIPDFVAWANLHGLWVIGLGVVGLYLLFTMAGHTPMSPAWRWVLATFVGCLLATMLTPAGPLGILYPLRYIQPGNWGLANIQEWQSPNFHDPVNWGFLVLIVALLLNGGRSTPAWLVAASVVGLVLGLASVRNEPIAAILAVPSLGYGIEERRGRLRPLRAARRAPVALGRRVLELGTGVLLAAAAALILLPSSPLEIVHVPPNPYPVQATTVMLHMKPDMRVLAEYGWGGYEISRINDAGGRVFVDGRNGMYSEQILNDYSTIRDVSGDWASLTQKYGVEAMLFPPYATIVKGAATDAGWCQAYRDASSVLLVKDCSLLDKR
jgi:hypothetical protein